MTTGAGVEFVRADLSEALKDYVIIDDAVSGERRMKECGETYLPMPDAHDKGSANKERYKAYIKRAVFYNVTQRTLDGLVGEVFLRPPITEVPDELQAVIKDANGDGVSLEQQAKTALSSVLSKGRGGVFVDYPVTDGETTRQQQLDRQIRPTICFYRPEDIINWQTIKRGGKWLLSLVVLRERYDRIGADGFTVEVYIRYRVLKLVNDIYLQYVYEQIGNAPTIDQAPGGVVATGATAVNSVPQVFNIVGPDGQPFREIPFTFIGARDNSQKIGPMPMLPLATLNIAHFRNSADYEESIYIVGQPTPVATGLNASWVKDILKGVLKFGSRGGI